MSGNQQQQRSSLTVQAFWLLIAKTLAFMFAFALPVLLTRSLSQNEYGLFKQVFLIITTATALLPLGFGMSAYYYLPRENDMRRRGQIILNILLFNLIMGAAACLVLVFWPGLIARIFQRSDDSHLCAADRCSNPALAVLSIHRNGRDSQPGTKPGHDLYRLRTAYADDTLTRRGDRV